MKKIVLDMQSGIHAHNMERMLLLMEVKAYSPWMFLERMKIRDRVKRSTENCRVILFVDDESDNDLTEKVRQAKREGRIDAFLFGSVSETYFASVIDSV